MTYACPRAICTETLARQAKKKIKRSMIAIFLFMFGAFSFFFKLEPALERMRSFTIEWYVYTYIFFAVVLFCSCSAKSIVGW